MLAAAQWLTLSQRRCAKLRAGAAPGNSVSDCYTTLCAGKEGHRSLLHAADHPTPQFEVNSYGKLCDLISITKQSVY